MGWVDQSFVLEWQQLFMQRIVKMRAEFVSCPPKRGAEVRAADFVGPGAESALGERTVRRIRRGKSVSVLGRAHRLHTWSFTEDVASMLVVAGTDPNAWGRAWHVPSNEPRTQREVISDLGTAAGTGQVRVSAVPSAVLAGMGLVWPLMRELRETVRKMLKENGSPPPPDHKWADIALLEPVRDYKARHASTMLTFDAVVDAIGQVEAREESSRPAAAQG